MLVQETFVATTAVAGHSLPDESARSRPPPRFSAPDPPSTREDVNKKNNKTNHNNKLTGLPNNY